MTTKKALDEAEVRGGEMALIEYTGGSTGVPKGVMLSNNNLNSYYINFLGSNNKGYTNYHHGDRFLACVPLFLAFGVVQLAMAVYDIVDVYRPCRRKHWNPFSVKYNFLITCFF